MDSSFFSSTWHWLMTAPTWSSSKGAAMALSHSCPAGRHSGDSTILMSPFAARSPRFSSSGTPPGSSCRTFRMRPSSPGRLTSSSRSAPQATMTSLFS